MCYMEKWFVINKGADFEKLGKEFGISPVTARLIRNREVIKCTGLVCTWRRNSQNTTWRT